MWRESDGDEHGSRRWVRKIKVLSGSPISRRRPLNHYDASCAKVALGPGVSSGVACVNTQQTQWHQTIAVDIVMVIITIIIEVDAIIVTIIIIISVIIIIALLCVHVFASTPSPPVLRAVSMMILAMLMLMMVAIKGSQACKASAVDMPSTQSHRCHRLVCVCDVVVSPRCCDAFGLYDCVVALGCQ